MFYTWKPGKIPEERGLTQKNGRFSNKLQGGPLLVISRVMTLINGRKMIGYQGLIASYYRGYNPLIPGSLAHLVGSRRIATEYNRSPARGVAHARAVETKSLEVSLALIVLV